MQQKQLLIALVWISIVLFFVYSWVHRNSATRGPLSPLEQSQQGPPMPHVPKPAQMDTRNFQLIKEDRYRFTIKFALINIGEKPAEQISVRVLPWLGGDYDPDKGLDIDPMDPILKQGKDAYVQRLNPKQSVNLEFHFFQWPGYTPSGHGRVDHEIQVQFKEVDEPETKKPETPKKP